MRPEVIESFTRSFFVGVVDIKYFEIRKRRNIKVFFHSKKDMLDSLNRAREANAQGLFLANEDNLTLMADRDNFETAMYLTASKGAMEAWSIKLEQQVMLEREAEEEAQDEKSNGDN